MKGMFAILGCLFAAYAAPLFGNEVPLVLEETIQLPVVPEVWDVAQISMGTYVWAIGDCTGTSHDGYPLCAFFFGTSATGVLDTFRVGSYNSSGHGFPVYAEIFRNEGDSLQCLAASYFHRDCSLGNGEVSIGVYDSTSGRPIMGRSWVSYHSQNPFEPDLWCFHTLHSLNAVPAYPDASARIVGIKSHYDNRLQDRTPNILYQDWYQSNSGSLLDANVYMASMSQWAYQFYWVVVDDGTSFCGFQCPILRKYELSGDSAISSSFWPSAEQTLGECLQLLATWDETIQSALVILQTPDSLKAWSDTSNSTIWRYATTYRTALLADATQNLVGEELLVAEPQFAVLHIRNPRNFQFWGQTSRFDPGFNEIKVVSRYSDDYRRLVVRYGSELRIYRFGEPIFTDADARSELPQELALSAYPNPFNPTTMLAFDLPKATRASLNVYDLTGRQVQTLLDEQMSAGHH